MLKFNSKALAIVLAAAGMASAGVAVADNAQGVVTVNATLAAGCTVSTGTITIASFTALASTAAQTGNSGSTFKVACTTGLTPTISSASPRIMSMTDGSGTHTLPFSLSQTSAGTSLSTDSAAGDSFTTPDGSPQTVPLFATVQSADFGALPAGSYTTNVTLDVAY